VIDGLRLTVDVAFGAVSSWEGMWEFVPMGLVQTLPGKSPNRLGEVAIGEGFLDAAGQGSELGAEPYTVFDYVGRPY